MDLNTVLAFLNFVRVNEENAKLIFIKSSKMMIDSLMYYLHFSVPMISNHLCLQR